jgi:hypothetical protein
MREIVPKQWKKIMQAIKQALTEANARPFQSRYFSKPKHEAQDALMGRTHYVDDSTLRYFHARITDARPIMEGLFFEIMESSSKDMHNTARGFRVVVFDVFGEPVYRPSIDDMKSTSAAAHKAYVKDFAIDPAAHYAQKLQGRAHALAREAEALTKAAEQVTA